MGSLVGRSKCRGTASLMLSAFLILLLLGSANAGFVRSYLTVNIAIDEDGSANVHEELRFYMDTAQSVDLYKISLKATNSLSGWMSRITLPDVRYHMDSANAKLTDLRIQPANPDTCDYYQNTCYGTFVMEYKVAAPTDDKGMVNIKLDEKPRTITYLLNSHVLLFETSLVEESYLPDMTTLEIRIPQGSRVLGVSPKPVEYADVDSVPSDASKFTWHGRLSLTKFQLQYERKESILSEVTNFFTQFQHTVVAWVTSREGTALIGVVAILLVGYIALQKKKE